MGVYTDEETNPVVGLFSYAITNRHPHIQIPFCKEFSSSYSSIVSTIDSSSSTPGVEIVDWVTSCGKISIAPLPRAVIHQHNLLHRGIGVIILDKDNSVFIHQRASSKRIFPSMFDMFIGGVSASGEASVQTLIRELKEEVGLDVVAATQVSNGSGSDDTSVQFIGSTTVETTCNHCVVDCFVLKCSSTLRGSIKFADGEVQWGAWMTPEEFSTFLKEQRLNFVPDGLQVWDAMPKMLAADFHAIIES
jgi:isopentenyldiphosphate isomerase